MSGDVKAKCKVAPEKGLVTWDAEGNEGGLYHSRKLHVPSDKSGLTVGRGYDLREKNSGKVVNDLTTAGVSAKQAKALSKATGKTGDKAKAFIKDNKLSDYEIDQCTQKNLFDITYKDEAKEAKRVCEKKDVTKAYGECDFDNLHPAIEEMVVDLKFRGDYTPNARKVIQKHISANDLEGFTKEMIKQENWKAVPSERFKSRKKFLQNALKEQKKQDDLKKKVEIKPLG